MGSIYLLSTNKAVENKSQPKKSFASWDLNPGPLGEKRERYLYALRPPKTEKLHVLKLFDILWSSQKEKFFNATVES